MMTSAKSVSKAPADCTSAEISDFKAFVLAGGEVDKNGLEGRIRLAVRLAFLREGTCLVGIAALKRPNSSYRERVALSAGTLLPSTAYPYELGWVFILPSARGKGYSHLVVQAALEVAQESGVFSTSRADNDPMHRVLDRFGFSLSGSTYASTRGAHDLKLFAREPPIR